MTLEKGLIIGGMFWLLFNLSGRPIQAIIPPATPPDVIVGYFIVSLVLSFGMIAWGALRVRLATPKQEGHMFSVCSIIKEVI